MVQCKCPHHSLQILLSWVGVFHESRWLCCHSHWPTLHVWSVSKAKTAPDLQSLQQGWYSGRHLRWGTCMYAKGWVCMYAKGWVCTPEMQASHVYYVHVCTLMGSWHIKYGYYKGDNDPMWCHQLSAYCSVYVTCVGHVSVCMKHVIYAGPWLSQSCGWCMDSSKSQRHWPEVPAALWVSEVVVSST